MTAKRIGMMLMLITLVAWFAVATGTQEMAEGEVPTVRATNYDRGRIAESEGTMADNRWVDWINENAPVNVEYVVLPRWEAEEILNTQFAAGDAPDYVFNYSAGWNKAKYTEGLTLPLDDYLDEYAPNVTAFLEDYPVAQEVATMPDGQMHFFPIAQRMGPNWSIAIRTDWLENLGLSIPETTDDLYDVAHAFTYDDPDGNGEDDTWGINLSWVSGLIVDNMFGRADGDFYIQGDDYVLDWERLQASTAWKKRAYDAGLVDPDFLTDNNGNKAQQDFITGKLGIYLTAGGVRSRSLHEAILTESPDAEFTFIPYPESPYGSFNPIHDAPFGIRSFINARTNVPEAAVQYGDFMQSLETYTTLTYGLEGEHFEYGPDDMPERLVDDDERQTLFGWTVDLRNHFPQVQIPYEWVSPETRFLGRGPVFDKLYESYTKGIEIYVDPDKPYGWNPIDSLSLPALPQELDLVMASRQDVYDIWTRAIVSGDSLTIEEAREQVEELWDSFGGEQLEQFYSDWYQENEDNIVLSSQWYE